MIDEFQAVFIMETCKGIAHKWRLQIIRSDISGEGLYTINLVGHKW